MGRKPRVEFDGAIYHVIHRGNNREYIFKEDEDKGYLLAYLEEIMEIHPFTLLGYVIMDNHYHLIIQAYKTPLQKIMQKLNNKYSKNYNKRHNRSGHVFGGRYKGILVKDDRYILSLLRYIHQNPVHAGICKSMEDYTWSSDQFYRNRIKKMVEIDKILSMFSADINKALYEYIKFMEKREFLDLAKKLYEDTNIIGEDDDLHKQRGRQKKSLDKILLDTEVNKGDFILIKEGSRKRYLRNYKIKYAKSGIAEGYTLKEIGANINLSGEAINQMAASNPQREGE